MTILALIDNENGIPEWKRWKRWKRVSGGRSGKVPLRKPCDHFIGWEEEEGHGVFIIMKSCYNSKAQRPQYNMDFKFTYCPKCGAKL